MFCGSRVEDHYSKFYQHWIGPYEVITVDDVNFTLNCRKTKFYYMPID